AQRRLGLCLARERISVALVQPLDSLAVEPLLADLQIGAGERLGRKLLDSKPDRLGGARKAPVAEGSAPILAVMGWEQLRLARIIEAARLKGGLRRTRLHNSLFNSDTGHDDVFGC